jgi:hypothetical protein
MRWMLAAMVCLLGCGPLYYLQRLFEEIENPTIPTASVTVSAPTVETPTLEPTLVPTATPASSASGGLSLGCLPFANEAGERHTDGEVRCWADYSNDRQETVDVRWSSNGAPVTSSLTNGASHTLYYTPPSAGRYWLQVEVRYPDGTRLQRGTWIVMGSAAGPIDAGGGGGTSTDAGPTPTPCRGLLCVEVEEPVEIPGQ